MNVLLVSGRYTGPNDRHDTDEAFARGLVGIGCGVRWVVPVPDSASARECDGVRVCAVETQAPRFAAIEGRLSDPVLERAVSTEIRLELPDVVHLLDYGGATSVNASWVAHRLGVSTVVSLQAASTLCHRGDLVHVNGSSCTDWLDPRRCAACCQRASPGGLSGLGAGLARFFTAVRWPLHPYPTPIAFENRRDLLLGGLQFVDRICVDRDGERDLTISLGVRPDQVAILPRSASVGDWRSAYEAVR